MVDANEKDEAPKSNISPEKDVAPKSNISPEKDVAQSVDAPSTILSNMEKEDDEDEDEEDEEYGEEEDEEEYEEEDEEPEDGEEEKVNDGGRTMVVVKDDSVDEENKKGKAIPEEETNKENAVEPKNGEELGENSKKKGKRPRNRNRKKDAQKASGTAAADGDKPESSSKKNASKRVESMGMVFMCSSKTKNDCFRYKILGLPASKKDQVAKIYKGMRLFLFDVDLRLMYGIFKAAGPGGYNIEPKAFKSDFPSQVRFTVLEDCLPLAEEKFKEVIKENYYTRNKFEGQLKAEQVKKLCKLFVVTGKGGPRPKAAIMPRRTRPVENHRIRADENRRIRADENRRIRADDAHESRDHKKRKRRPHSPPGREKRRYTDYERPRPEPPVLYDREPPAPRYLPPRPPPPAIASPVRSYGYERPYDTHPYARERVPDHHPYRVLDVEPRHHDEFLSRDRDRDPYDMYSREAPVYRDTVYTVPPEYHLVSREYHPVEPPEYRLSGGSRVGSYRDVEVATDYRSSAGRLPEYRSRRTHYKY